MEALAELREFIRPAAFASERIIPVHPHVGSLLPQGGLLPGSVVSVRGSLSLAFALLAAATNEGRWAGVVGGSQVGWAAVADLGVTLDRLLVVPRCPSNRWTETTAALIDGLAVVLLVGSPRVTDRDARRLIARARERDTALVLAGVTSGWPIAADVVIDAAGEWQGLERGSGRFQQRSVRAVTSGRRSAGRERHLELVVPSTDGSIAEPARPHPAPERHLRIAQ